MLRVVQAVGLANHWRKCCWPHHYGLDDVLSIWKPSYSNSALVPAVAAMPTDEQMLDCYLQAKRQMAPSMNSGWHPFMWCTDSGNARGRRETKQGEGRGICGRMFGCGRRRGDETKRGRRMARRSSWAITQWEAIRRRNGSVAPEPSVGRMAYGISGRVQDLNS